MGNKNGVRVSSKTLQGRGGCRRFVVNFVGPPPSFQGDESALDLRGITEEAGDYQTFIAIFAVMKTSD